MTIEQIEGIVKEAYSNNTTVRVICVDDDAYEGRIILFTESWNEDNGFASFIIKGAHGMLGIFTNEVKEVKEIKE